MEFYCNTNIGFMPVKAFNDLRAQSEGYSDYEDMQRHGKTLPQPQDLYRMTQTGTFEYVPERVGS